MVARVVIVDPQPLDLFIRQFPMETAEPVGLYSSMNSSLAPLGPLVRNSLMTMLPPPVAGVLLAAVLVSAAAVAVAFTADAVAVEFAAAVLVRPAAVPVRPAADAVAVKSGLGSPQLVMGLEEFCGSLGLRRKKSVELLFESMQLKDGS